MSPKARDWTTNGYSYSNASSAAQSCATEGGSIVSTPSNTNAPYQVSVSQSVASSWDLDGSVIPPATTTYQYDAHGNPIQVVASTPDGFSNSAHLDGLAIKIAADEATMKALLCNLLGPICTIYCFSDGSVIRRNSRESLSYEQDGTVVHIEFYYDGVGNYSYYLPKNLSGHLRTELIRNMETYCSKKHYRMTKRVYS